MITPMNPKRAMKIAMSGPVTESQRVQAIKSLTKFKPNVTDEISNEIICDMILHLKNYKTRPQAQANKP